MSAPSVMVAVLLLAPSLEAQYTQTTLAPAYSTASIANAATNLPSGFAPNSIISIYGQNLSFETAGANPSATGYLPITLSGVQVYIGNTVANLFYVSPQQINVLIPSNIGAGPTTVTVAREGTVGPTVPIILTTTAPGLFQIATNTVLATHANGALITSSSPASAGEVIIIYAIGLGGTVPRLVEGAIPSVAAQLSDPSLLSVLLNGQPVNPPSIQYAGVTPGDAGLYQINLLLPTPVPANPELRVAIGPEISPAGLTLPTQ